MSHLLKHKKPFLNLGFGTFALALGEKQTGSANLPPQPTCRQERGVAGVDRTSSRQVRKGVLHRTCWMLATSLPYGEPELDTNETCSEPIRPWLILSLSGIAELRLIATTLGPGNHHPGVTGDPPRVSQLLAARVHHGHSLLDL